MTVFQHGDPVRMRAHTLTPHTTGTVTGTTPEGRVLVRWDDNHAITEQVPHYLTPLGEPMSKTFKSTNDVDDPVHHLTTEARDGEVLIQVHYGQHLKGIHLAPAEAPALALAILEAAGHKGASSSSCLMQAFDLIEQHIKEEAVKAKEAADREALEGDAVRLYDAWRSELHNMTNSAWGELPDYHRAAWIGVARAARAVREMTGAKA